MIRKLSLAAIAASSILLAGSAFAGTTPGTSFTVQVQVTAGCVISTDLANVNFGSAAGTATKPANISQNASITCTNGTPYDFHMSSANFGGGTFNMKSAAGGLIPYTIQVGGANLGNTQVTAGFSQTGSGAAQSVPFTFGISSWSAAFAPGSYTDTVTMNVDF